MKKIVGFVFSILIFAVSLVSCGKAEWIKNFEEGKVLAEKNGKSIILNFTSSEDQLSDKLKENGFGNDKFLKKYSKEFVFVELDFTDRLNAESLNPSATEEERAAAQKIIEETEESMKVAENYAIRSLPTTLVLSKEGYVVSNLEFFKVREDFNPDSEDAKNASAEDVFNIDKFDEICKKVDDAMILANDFKNNIKIANGNGKIEDRIAAIDEVFDSTDFQYRYLIRDLSKLAVELDTENITGSMAKHVMSVISAEAVEAGDDFKKASEIFASGAERKFLTESDRQLLFYQAAMASFRLGKDGYADAKFYIQKSINVSPNSEHIELLNMMLEQIDLLTSKSTEISQEKR